MNAMLFTTAGTAQPCSSRRGHPCPFARQALVLQEMSRTRNSVTVRVPATSANLGPGFDTLGMALDMWSVPP